MTGRRGLAVTLSAWVVAAAVTLWAAGRVWGSVTVVAQSGVRVHAQVTGHDVASALAPCAIALFALAVAVLAASGWMRRACGALAAVIGVVVVVTALVGQHRIGTTLTGKVFAAQVAAVHPPATGWPWLAVVGGLLATACGAATAVFGARWSGLGRRYDAPGAESPVLEDDASRWAALDRGEDPTA
jgi:Tryptophan-associated transmembrane protein (Trp_oprn_chp)